MRNEPIGAKNERDPHGTRWKSLLTSAALLLAFCAPIQAAAPMRMKITFSGYTTPDTLTHFPALVTFSNDAFVRLRRSGGGRRFLVRRTVSRKCNDEHRGPGLHVERHQRRRDRLLGTDDRGDTSLGIHEHARGRLHQHGPGHDGEQSRGAASNIAIAPPPVAMANHRINPCTSHRFLTMELGYGIVQRKNRVFDMAQQTCWPGNS